jgi:hypothetical protein
MKRCPTCQRTFADETQKFCANDGTPLVADEAPAFDPEATVMSSARPILEEEPAEPASDPLPPTQYFVPGSEPVAQAQPEPQQDIHQSYPPPQLSAPGAAPSASWSPTPQQPPPQPYYPQQGMPGGQPAPPPPWQGGQPQGQQPPWMPQGNQPQGQNWGAGGYNQPGPYAPYGATPAAAGGSSKVATASLISGIISFVAIAALFIIIGARIRDLRDLIEPLGWLSLVTGLAALVCGIIGLITTKTSASRIKSGIGIFLGILPLLLFLIGMARRF